jgi:uncharacterized repeat protein (TIGR01451 family)
MGAILKLITAIFVVALPSAALAADAVALSSTVFVERESRDADGRIKTELAAPKLVTPGDRLVFILNYRNVGAEPATNFVVTNPLPEAVAFVGTPDERALFSVDGGRSWGALATLTIREKDGQLRSARPSDVTHIRWTLQKPLAAGAAGKLSFRGIVR